MKLKVTPCSLALCLAAACAPGLVWAHDAKTAAVKPSDATSDMKVARDKDTGQLRALTPEEAAELGAKARTGAPHVLVVRRPVTTVVVRPDGSAVARRSLDDMENLVLTRTPDGKAVFSHSDKPAPAAPTK